MLLAGIAMIALPGPAFIIIPAGLAILATEFEWAHRFKERFKGKYHDVRDRYRQRHESKARNAA